LTFAQEEETDTSTLDPAFRIVNIPNEGILTKENDTIYKQQLAMQPENQPLGIADAAENTVSLASFQNGAIILVADSGTKKVQKFDSNGTLQNEWQSTDLGKITFAGNIDVSATPDGNILVADSGTKKVQKFDSNGTLQNQWQYADKPVKTSPYSAEENDSFDIEEEIEQDPSIAPQAFTSSQSQENKPVISPGSISSNGEQEDAERDTISSSVSPSSASSSSSSSSSSDSSSTLHPTPSEGTGPVVPPSPSPATSSSSSSSSPPFTP
jgi:hypothetical protein